MKQKPVVFEMETSDPDDFLTLCWLADHPDVDLLAVLVTPGGEDQCRLVRWALDQCGRQTTPIGSRRSHEWRASAEGNKPRVSEFHYTTWGASIRDHPVGEILVGPALLRGLLMGAATPCDDPSALRTEDLTVLVGSPPRNIGEAFTRPNTLSADSEPLRLGRWVQQGGFAGDNIVPPEHRLAKFDGKLTCPSFNPGGAHKETLALLAHPGIARRLFVSKNVCHGVTWTAERNRDWRTRATTAHQMRVLDAVTHHILPLANTRALVVRRGLQLMAKGFDAYLLARGGVAKAMHDLVAAACVLDESVCTFAEVEIYRERGEWGARPAAGTNTFISTAIDMDRFLGVLAR